MTETINKDEATINGVPVKELSTTGQALFDRLLTLKGQADEAKATYDAKQAALKELSDMILEEVNKIKAAQEAASSVVEGATKTEANGE